MSFKTSKYASSFSPQDLPGLAVWLDAADSTAVTQSGGSVSAWRGKSPLTLDMVQNTSGARPTYESNVQNGLPALRFTTSQMMQSTSNLTLPPDQTWFVSFRPLAGSNMIFIEQSPDVNTNQGSYFYGSNNALVQIRRSGVRTIFDASGVGATVFPLGSWYIASVVNSNVTNVQSNDVYWSINGARRNTTIDSNLLTGSASNLLYINPTSRVTASNYTGEILIYNRALPPSEVRLVERYLSYKWGVSLPTTHPFFSTPAVTRPFNPLDVSGCAIWLDAADYGAFTFSSGSNVSQWNDKSGSGLNFSTTTGTVAYSNQGLTFPSGGAIMTSVSNFSLTSNTYVFAVARLGVLTGLPTFIAFSDITTMGYLGAYSIRYGNGLLVGVPNNGGDVNDFGNSNYYVNGSLQPSFTSAVYTARHIVSGQSTNSGGSTAVTVSGSFFGRFFNGDVHEVLFYSSPPSTTQRQQIENYLAEKWNLRSSLSTSNALRLFRALSPVFNPTLLSNCTLWLDAADYGTLSFSTGSNVTQWNDKSGLANNATQSTSNARPLYTTLNSRPAVVFGGLPTYTKTFMTLSNITSVPISIFMVATSTENLTNTFYISLGVFPNAIYVRQLFDPNFFGIDGGSGGQYISTVRDLNPHVWSFTLPASANGVFALDGTVVATSGFTLGANTTFTSNSLGTWNQQPTDGNVRGGISEAIIINRALSTADRQRVEGYLAWKWGLVGSLPSTHPYKKTPV
jgi:hypothetical protein